MVEWNGIGKLKAQIWNTEEMAIQYRLEIIHVGLTSWSIRVGGKTVLSRKNFVKLKFLCTASNCIFNNTLCRKEITDLGLCFRESLETNIFVASLVGTYNVGYFWTGPCRIWTYKAWWSGQETLFGAHLKTAGSVSIARPRGVFIIGYIRYLCWHFKPSRWYSVGHTTLWDIPVRIVSVLSRKFVQ